MGAFDDLISKSKQHPATPPPQGNLTLQDLVAKSMGLHRQAVDWREHGALGAVDATIRAAANGVPIIGPLANRGDAALNAAGSYLTDKLGAPNNANQFDVHGASLGERYNRALAIQDAIDHQFAADHPVVATVAGLVGGGLGSLAGARYLSPLTAALQRATPEAGLIPKVFAGAGDGGMVGGAGGYLGGRGGPTDPSRIQAAKQGAVWGAAGGAAAPVVAKVGGAVWNATGGKLLNAARGPVTVGVPKAPTLADAVGTGRVVPEPTPQQRMLAEALNPAGAKPPPPPPQVHPRLSPVVTVSRSAAQGAYDRIYRQLERSHQSVAEALGRVDKLGPNGLLADANRPLQDFAQSVVDAPGQGGRIAKEALDLRQSGLLDRGQYSVQPSNLRINEELKSALGLSDDQFHDQVSALLARQKSDAGPAYAKAYMEDPVPLSDLGDFATSPLFTKAYDRARAISQAEFVPQPDGTMKLQPLPEQMPDTLDWRTLDLARRGLDDTYREGVTSGIGANAQNATKDFGTAFVAKLDGLNPDYLAARHAFSGPVASMDALEAGRNFVNDDATGLTSDFDQLTPGDQQFFRLGAARGFQDRLGSVPNTYDAAGKAGVNTNNAMDKLRAVFPDDQSWGDFSDQLQNEQAMFNTRDRVLGGSSTRRNLQGPEDAGMDPLDLLRSGAEIMDKPVTGSLSLLAKVLKSGDGEGMDEPTADAAGAILFNADPAMQLHILTGVEQAAQRAAMARVLTNFLPAAAGTAAGDYATDQSQGAIQ